MIKRFIFKTDKGKSCHLKSITKIIFAFNKRENNSQYRGERTKWDERTRAPVPCKHMFEMFAWLIPQPPRAVEPDTRIFKREVSPMAYGERWYRLFMSFSASQGRKQAVARKRSDKPAVRVRRTAVRKALWWLVHRDEGKSEMREPGLGGRRKWIHPDLYESVGLIRNSFAA